MLQFIAIFFFFYEIDCLAPFSHYFREMLTKEIMCKKANTEHGAFLFVSIQLSGSVT